MLRSSTLLLLSSVCFMSLCALEGLMARADEVNVIGGQTSVLLNTDLLSSVGLTLSGVSSDVIVPGNLGPTSVAFNINPRDAVNPTTFSYTVGSFAPFSGTIEHTGSVFFNDNMLTVGDFSIAYDMDRVAGDNSGFFVESTIGLSAILFDLANVSTLTAGASSLVVGGDLVVSPELAGVLGDNNLTGVDVGDALVEAKSIPEPGSLAVLAISSLVLVRRKRTS